MTDRPPGTKVLIDLISHAVFWVWNLWLVSIFTFGIGPILLSQLLIATWMGIVPSQFTAFVAVLVALPVLTMGLGLWKLRTRGPQLLTLLYGIEIPLLFLFSLRVFAIHELSAPTALALGTVLVGMAGLLRVLLHGPRESNAIAQFALLLSQIGFAMAALWWGAVTGIYGMALVLNTLIAVPEALRNLTQFPTEIGFYVFFGFLGVSLIIFACTPLVMVGIAVRTLQLVGRETEQTFGRPLALGASGLVLVVWSLAFALVSHQPQRGVFELLDGVKTDADRRAVLEQLPRVRQGLLAARLGPDRLFEGDAEHIRHAYAELGVFAEAPAALWTVLFAPFVYDAVDAEHLWTNRSGVTIDVRTASEHYARVFDGDIRRQERDALIASARSTWNWQQAAADIFDIGEQKVWLARQDITAAPQPGGFTTVTVHDVYQNRTFTDAEIVYHFSLPEGAAITGLALNDREDRSTAFTQVVAPRGAAQEVYEREVRRRVDPALLEQVGPRQYRLRAFPVQAREGRPDSPSSFEGLGAEFHLWLDLVVPSVQQDGNWVTPLPVLSEVRNAYWDGATTRTLPSDSWLPASLPGATAPAPHSVVLQGWQIDAVPTRVTAQAPATLAVLIDGSYSMHANRDRVASALAELRAAGTTVQLYCTREATVQACSDFDAATALFWGNDALGPQLAGWKGIADAPRLLVLSDAGTYRDPDALPDLELPETWVVHLDGFPGAYDDWTLDRIQRSGGGVVGSVAEALQRLQEPRVIDGWRWSMVATDAPDSDDAFAPIAARQAVHLLDLDGDAGLQHLDQQHALAVSSSIVTHYSSMIVLVNDWQRQALAEASNREDRFDREATDDEFSEVSAVPEPATWLLLLCGGGLLLGTRQKSRLTRT